MKAECLTYRLLKSVQFTSAVSNVKNSVLKEFFSFKQLVRGEKLKEKLGRKFVVAKLVIYFMKYWSHFEII